MSTQSIFGMWKVGSVQISIYLSPARDQFSEAYIQAEENKPVQILSPQIKCGISGNIPHIVFIRRVERIAQDKIRENLAVCTYPEKGPAKEVWIFEAKLMIAPWIQKALFSIWAANISEGIKCLQSAKRLQVASGENEELNSVLLSLTNKHSLLSLKEDAPIYLSTDHDQREFNNLVELYQDHEGPFLYFTQFIQACEINQPHLHYLAARVHEHNNKPASALPHYLYLAEKHLNPIPILRKAAALIQTTADPFAFPHFLEKLDRHWLGSIRSQASDTEIQKWVLQKDAIRMAFEEFLSKLRQCSPQTRPPTCFICFNVDERDVGQWLEHTLIPDLDRIGVQPVFCFRDLGPGKELNTFQGLIRRTDLVIVICTPEFKRKCAERTKAITGVAQEVRLAKERYNDPDKYETIFPLYMKGDRESSCPTDFFEPILGTHLNILNKVQDTSVWSYYGGVFELFGAMRKIPREVSRQLKDEFLEKTKQILSGQIQEGAITEWQNSRAHRTQEILRTAHEKALQQTQNLPSSALQTQGPTPDGTFNDDLRITLERLRKEIQGNEYRQNERALYIESDSVSDLSLIYRPDAATSLKATFEKFMRGPKQVLLLQAFAGSGKTMFTEEIEQELLAKFDPKNPQSRIPLRIELGGLTDPVHNAIEEGLINKGFSKEQIQQLEQLPVVIILDGVDEARKDGKRLSPTHHLYLTNKLYRFKNAKVIFGLRVGGGSEGRVDANQFRPYRSAAPTSVENENSLEKIVICPFTEEKIKRYILLYVSKAPQEWKQKFARWIVHECAFFFQMIRAIQGASDLAKIPFTLRLLAQYLPAIVEEATQGASSLNATSLKITESQIYELFLNHWFEREKQKLVGKTLPDEFNEQTPEEFAWSYSMHLAKTMSLEGENHVGITQIVYKKKLPFTTRDENRFKKWDDFFSDEPIPWTCQRLAPLRRSDQGGQITYSFIHPFIQDFLVARQNKIEADAMGV